MKALQRKDLEQLIAGSAEPVVVAQINSADWPVVLCNPAFEGIAGKEEVHKKPFADVIEKLVGRDLALEISETIRAGQETTLPVALRDREYLLVLKPLNSTGKDNTKYYAGYLRACAGANGAGGVEVQQALLKAKRRIRNLSRDDSVTGLLNAKAFRDVLDHDWAVAKREKSSLALVAFTIDNFEQYREVFGRHATDTCLRRVAQAIRHCLKRASDVAARVNCEQGDKLIVLSHASDEAGVRDFAARIATSVRELGLHHPRSKAARFVTVSYQLVVKEVGADPTNAAAFLEGVLK
jgi:diguanylate cyclase (GGDEF)-like protein